jgi:hypothetical protein
MASQAHLRDVVETALALLGVRTPEGTVAYRPGHRLFDVLQSAEEFDEVTIAIEGRTKNFRDTLAALQIVQLAVDGAAMAVGFYDRYPPSDGDVTPTRSLLEELDLDPIWELEIVELSAGSFRARLKALITDPGSRRKAFPIAGLATAVLSAIFIPAGPFITLGIAAATAAAAFIPEKPVKQVLTERLVATQAEGGGEPDWNDAEKAVFDKGFDQLTQYLQDQLRLSVARDDALRAEVESLKVTVQQLQQGK